MSLDSYSEGYGSAINWPSYGGLAPTSIGDFTVQSRAQSQVDQNTYDNWQTAGFYAIAYKNDATGETVIAYRGTDHNTAFNRDLGGSDLVSGYGIALGAAPGTSFDLATEQARLAQVFYKSVTGNTATQADANTTLVGHSLGGGLAGFVNATTGTKAVVFDNLPYDVSAEAEAAQLGVTAKFGTVSGYFTDGEFLEGARSGDIQGAVGGLLLPLLGPGIDAYGLGLGSATAKLEASWRSKRCGHRLPFASASADRLDASRPTRRPGRVLRAPALPYAGPTTSLSIRRPSSSTTSNRHPCSTKLSPCAGSRRNAASANPAAVA